MLTGKEETMKQVKVIIEKHPDGYVAYPVGIKGVVVVRAIRTKMHCGTSSRP